MIIGNPGTNFNLPLKLAGSGFPMMLGGVQTVLYRSHGQFKLTTLSDVS